MASSEDEFEIECEEIILSDSEDMDPLQMNTDDGVKDQGTSSKETSKEEGPKLVPLRGMSLNMLPDAAKLQYIRRPTRPVRLFSFIERDLVDRFSKTTEASKPLALRLLEIVKTVNLRRAVKVENGVVVPNFYLMATQCEPKEGEKITKLESSDIVNLVKDIIHMIKIGIYRQVDFVDIICDSPAIFLIKYINVKNWDAKMNAVYVVTSEYLLPYLCKIRAAEEEEEKARKRIKKSKWERDERYQSMTPAKRKRTEKSNAATSKKKNQSKEVIEVEVKPEVVPWEDDDVIVQSELQICTSTSETEDTTEEPAPKIMENTKSHEETVSEILSKYLEPEAVRFFTIQMKLSGKSATHCRWSEEDKQFAFNLMNADATQYNLLLRKYSLPSKKVMDRYKEKLKQEAELKKPAKVVKPVRRSTRRR